jgi:transposase
MTCPISQKGELAFLGNGKQKLAPQEEEIKRLKKELYDVRQERDILKKALAIVRHEETP